VQFPIQIELRRSRLLWCLTFLLHVVAAGCLLALPWPPEPRYLLLVLLALSAWQALRPSTIVGLRLGERGDLLLLFAGGDALSVAVQPDTVVFRQLLVLRVREDDRRRPRSLALLPDSLSAEQFRQLRLWLRWRVAARDQAGGDV
jgi:toxin CptA